MRNGRIGVGEIVFRTSGYVLRHPCVCFRLTAPLSPRQHSAFRNTLPFVGLYCVKKSWAYGEMWIVDGNSEAYLASCVFNTDDEEVAPSACYCVAGKSAFSAPFKKVPMTLRHL